MPRTRSHPAAFPSPPRSPIFLQVYTHGPNYRTLLVANSTVGLGFYPLNAEQDFGEAHTEVAAPSPAATSSTVPPLTPHLQPIPIAFLSPQVRFSANVTFFGAKSENNYAVLWVRDSADVTLHGYGGNAAAFANRSRGGSGAAAGDAVGVRTVETGPAVSAAAGRWRGDALGASPPDDAPYVRRDGRVAEYLPSLFRVQRSVRVRLANLVDAGRITSATLPSSFVAAGNGTDPREWNMVLRQDSDGGRHGGGRDAAELCTPRAEPGWCDATRVLDRPVLWEWGGAGATPLPA